MNICHKLWFSNFYIYSTQCRRSFIFQAINSARAYNLTLKYLRFTPSGSKDIGLGKFEFVAKTQFLSNIVSLMSDLEVKVLIWTCLLDLSVLKWDRKYNHGWDGYNGIREKPRGWNWPNRIKDEPGLGWLELDKNV